VCETTLAALPEAVASAGLTAPVLVIIGRVVEAMAWMDGRGTPDTAFDHQVSHG
jgi:siroheme synthase